MNSIEGALFSFLQNSPTVAAYVGGAAATPPSIPRIYPLVLRQDRLTLPALTYHIVAGHSELTVDGQGNRKGYKRIQISAWSASRLEAKAIIEAIRVLTNGYVGPWGDVNVSVTQFSYAPDMFDHISKLSHSPCQITLFHDEP